jgi:hypothetical protein
VYETLVMKFLDKVSTKNEQSRTQERSKLRAERTTVMFDVLCMMSLMFDRVGIKVSQIFCSLDENMKISTLSYSKILTFKKATIIIGRHWNTLAITFF